MAAKKNKCYSGHRLRPEDNGQIYDCDGCKMKAQGPTYRCGTCDFDLHPECMNSTDTISPDICQGQHFKFCERPPPPANQKPRKAKDLSPSVCSACGMGVEGFVYHCKETGTYLHPRCALLKAEIPVSAPAADDDDHPAVKFILKKESKYCDVCQSAELMSGVDEKIPGWCYTCIDDGGGEHGAFHVYCLMKLLMEKAHAKMKEGGGGSGSGSGGGSGDLLGGTVSLGGGGGRGGGCGSGGSRGGSRDVLGGTVSLGGGRSGSTSAENFTNGNPTLECLEIIKKPIRADIPSKYSKKKKPGGGGRTKFVLKICRSILAAIFSILFGDPTTLLANATMEVVPNFF